VRPEDSLFIDNSVENLFAPAALGMKAVYFDEEKNDVPALARHISNELGA
jgi:putative hydrolase of the HAD superfamily